MTQSRFSLAAGVLLALGFLLSGCHTETQEEKLLRIESDKSLDDEARIKQIAEAIFSVPTCDITKDATGSYQVKLVVHGDDTSFFGEGDTSGFLGGVNATEKRLNLHDNLDQMTLFLKKVESIKVAEIFLTLQTPLFEGRNITEWVDTYAYRLPAQNFPHLLEAKSLMEFDHPDKLLERIWTVEMDHFKDFKFEKKKGR